MEIYVLAFNGSPRKDGNTAKLLDYAIKGAKYEGARTKIIHLYDYNIKPCTGCLCEDIMKCKYPCTVEDDDMKQIYDEIIKAHAIIIATPIYWYNVSGPTKNLIDRMTVFENMIYTDGKCPTEGKVAGVIAAGNDSGCIAVISNLYATLNSMGFAIPPWALAYKNTMRLIEEEKNRILDAANVGRAVTTMAKLLKNGPDYWFDSKLITKIEDKENAKIS